MAGIAIIVPTACYGTATPPPVVRVWRRVGHKCPQPGRGAVEPQSMTGREHSESGHVHGSQRPGQDCSALLCCPCDGRPDTTWAVALLCSVRLMPAPLPQPMEGVALSSLNARNNEYRQFHFRLTPLALTLT